MVLSADSVDSMNLHGRAAAEWVGVSSHASAACGAPCNNPSTQQCVCTPAAQEDVACSFAQGTAVLEACRGCSAGSMNGAHVSCYSTAPRLAQQRSHTQHQNLKLCIPTLAVPAPTFDASGREVAYQWYPCKLRSNKGIFIVICLFESESCVLAPGVLDPTALKGSCQPTAQIAG